LSAAAAWNLHHWDRLEEYIGAMTENSLDGAFFRAISAVHHNEHGAARRCIDRSRHLLDTKLTALVGESYNRAYNVMVRVQQLSELEEVIEYKRATDLARKGTIRRIWDVRLMGCQRDGNIARHARACVCVPTPNISLSLIRQQSIRGNNCWQCARWSFHRATTWIFG
jgi:FKBP12-rapamycin complex-associated protein